MAERFKAAVLKTAVLERVPGVRIPLPPPDFFIYFQYLTPTGLRPVWNFCFAQKCGRADLLL
jgi:hypothetical protein